MDKTKNTRVEEEIDKSQAEIEKHGSANWKNIDDNPNNDMCQYIRIGFMFYLQKQNINKKNIYNLLMI